MHKGILSGYFQFYHFCKYMVPANLKNIWHKGTINFPGVSFQGVIEKRPQFVFFCQLNIL